MNIDNDMHIMKQTVQEKVGAGGVKFLFPMEEGDPITYMVQDASTISFADWCNIVRGEVRERENRKEAKARGTEAAPSHASERNSAEVRGDGGGNVSVQKALPATEGEMEELLRNTLSSVNEEIKARAEELSVIEARLESLYIQSHRLQEALKAYVSYGKNNNENDD